MYKKKYFSNITSAILCLLAVVTIYFAWSPFLQLTSVPQYHNGYEVPTRVVGVNFSISSLIWLGAFIVIFLIIFFTLAKRRKASSQFFWINGILIFIIGFHVFVSLFFTRAIITTGSHYIATSGSNYIAVAPVPWYHNIGEIVVIINILIYLVLITGLILTIIAIWRMMKAHENLAAAVKEISVLLKEKAALSEEEYKEDKK